MYDNFSISANSYLDNAPSGYTSSVTAIAVPPSPQGEGLAAAPLNDHLSLFIRTKKRPNLVVGAFGCSFKAVTYLAAPAI